MTPKLNETRGETKFGFRDKWNRTVGLVWSTYGKADGRFYFWAMAARNGASYGSSDACKGFDSAAARDAALAKYTATAAASSRKRLAKSGKLHPDDLVAA